jgi:hypothetical protein
MKNYVFISYSHLDEAYAHRLAIAMQAAGINVWLDDRIDYGAQWPREIQTRLEGCSAFILVMSPNSFHSDWVQNELAHAREVGKKIFPLLLDGSTTWLSVKSLQYVDVRGNILPPSRFYEALGGYLSAESIGPQTVALNPINIHEPKAKIAPTTKPRPKLKPRPEPEQDKNWNEVEPGLWKAKPTLKDEPRPKPEQSKGSEAPVRHVDRDIVIQGFRDRKLKIFKCSRCGFPVVYDTASGSAFLLLLALPLIGGLGGYLAFPWWGAAAAGLLGALIAFFSIGAFEETLNKPSPCPSCKAKLAKPLKKYF